MNLAIIFLIFLPCVFSINILMVITNHGHSHVAFANRIADVLIDGGHNLTIFQMPLSPYVTLKGNQRAARVIQYQTKNVDYGFYRNMSSVQGALNPSRKAARDVPALYHQRYLVCEEIVNDDSIISTLSATKFDMGIAEIIEACQEGLFELLGIQNIIHTSAIPIYSNIYKMYGIPDIPSFMPNMMLPLSNRMTLWQRWTNFDVSRKLSVMSDGITEKMTKLYQKKYGQDFPSLMELRKKKANFIFLNVNEHLDFPNLITTKVKYVGGLENRDHLPLTSEFTKIIDKYKGFVIFSFGSILKTQNIPANIRKEIIAAFEKFPDYAFFWKFEKDGIEDWAFAENIDNVYFESWLPQYALLNHPKCQVFISHVGYNSFQESIEAGIPIIAVPLFADQVHNAAVVVEKKLGIYLGRENLNTVGITKVLTKMLLSEKSTIYHETARKFAARMKDGMKIMSPIDTILKYVDFAYKHGNMPDMDLSSRELTFIQLYLLDIFGILLTAILIIALVSFFLLKWLVNLIFYKNSRKEKKQ